jgi:hypothetical protein
MSRKPAVSGRAAAVDQALQDMFRALQSRPVPGTLRSIVDQLDEGAVEARLRKRG